MPQTVSCFKCQTISTTSDRFGRRDECAKCRSDIHVCLNCVHYDPGAYNECKESSADYVKEKDRANFCDYFSPSSEAKSENKKDAILSAAEALFKKK